MTLSEIPELARFGANVRRERVARKITQEKLAELMEVNPRTVQKIEAGKLNILFTTILRLQSALGCSWDSLMNARVQDLPDTKGTFHL